MRIYQFSKSKIAGIGASVLVVVALAIAFATIFRVIPSSLTLEVSALRVVIAIMLFLVWIILNIPPPKLPSGNYIIALAQLGEEEEPNGAAEGYIRAIRRYKLRREDFDGYTDDNEIQITESRSVKEIRQIQNKAPRGSLREAAQPSALPAGVRNQTALALSARNGGSTSAERVQNLSEFSAEARNKAAALALDSEEDSSERRNSSGRPALKFTPPPHLWESVFGAREVTDFLAQDVKKQLTDVATNDVSIYPTGSFVGDGEIAIQQSEMVRAHAIIWGWVPYHTRRDFVPVFELSKMIEEGQPAPGDMQLLGITSFDLGHQTAKYSTIFSAFVAGLGAYAVHKNNKVERDTNLAKAENELSLALTAAYMYSEQRRHRHGV